MKAVHKILDKLNGLYYPQEYLCLTNESFEHPLHVYLAKGHRIAKDITKDHLFVGYSPLVFALAGKGQTDEPIDILFFQSPQRLNEIFSKKDAIASLHLKLVHKQELKDQSIYYYEGVYGRHRFLSAFHQFIIHLDNRLKDKKPGNISLKENLLDQVQIAYSVPRKISLITVKQQGLYNLFPTDLHGQVNEEYYIISLRHKGKACEQVERAGGILISEVDSRAYQQVYGLGKNHMQEPKPLNNFPLGTFLSPGLGLPLPEPALYYRELELKESFDRGIHRIMLFKILSAKALHEGQATLAHIHNCYATWRHNKDLEGNYLLR